MYLHHISRRMRKSVFNSFDFSESQIFEATNVVERFRQVIPSFRFRRTGMTGKTLGNIPQFCSNVMAAYFTNAQ